MKAASNPSGHLASPGARPDPLSAQWLPHTAQSKSLLKGKMDTACQGNGASLPYILRKTNHWLEENCILLAEAKGARSPSTALM
jgi:hypothetical protein